LEACGSAHKDVSVHTQPDLDDRKLKAMLMEKDKEIQGLKSEKDSEVGADVHIRKCE
jgi:hypothetical protein